MLKEISKLTHILTLVLFSKIWQGHQIGSVQNSKYIKTIGRWKHKS